MNKVARELVAEGRTDRAVLVLDTADADGGELAQVAASAGALLHAGGGRTPGVVCAMNRISVAFALDALANGAAKRVAAGPPADGGVWAVVVAFGGTMLTVWTPCTGGT